MKNYKLFVLLTFISSFIGYLEWGGNNSVFFFQAELDILNKLFTNPAEVLHPFILIPLAGQILLLIELLKNKPSKLICYLAISGIGFLMLMVLIIGCIMPNIIMLVTTLPFLFFSFLTIRELSKVTK